MAFLFEDKKTDSPILNQSEADIQKILYLNYIQKIGRYDFAIPNCYSHHDNECDVLAVRKSGFYDEFEIKISRSDFLADSRKQVYVTNPNFVDWKDRTKEHDEIMRKTKDWSSLEFYSPSIKKPKEYALIAGFMANYFWYVTPDGLVSTDELPEFAGLIEIKESGAKRVIKEAKKLHSTKLSFEDRYKIARKATYRIWQ